MKDYTFSYNAASEYSSEETTFKLACRTDDFFSPNHPLNKFMWDVFLNDQPTDWTLTNNNPDAYTSYWDLYRGEEHIHTYSFDMLSYLPNLMKIYQKIVDTDKYNKWLNETNK